MWRRLLATGLGPAVLVALATSILRPGQGEGSRPDKASSSSEEVPPMAAVVPPGPPGVRLPVGPKSSDSGVARFRGTVESRGGVGGKHAPRVRLLTSPQDGLLAVGTVRRDGAFELETRVPSSRLPLIVRLEVDRPGWVACGPLPGVHLVGTLPFEREGVRLSIAPGMEVRGRVTTIRGEPPPLPVRIVQPSEDSPGAIAGHFLRAMTDREGSFRALVPSTEPPVVLAQADGYLTVAEQWDTAAQEPLEIVLPREGDLPHVTGRVVRGDGRTGEAAQVTARLLDSSSRDRPPWTARAQAQRALYLRRRGEEPTATQANGMGWYSLALPTPGTWLLEFRGEFGAAERRVEVAESGPTRWDAVLEGDTFLLAGYVTDRSTGAPVPNAAVRLDLPGGYGGRQGPPGWGDASGTTDEGGGFRLGPLLGGVEKGKLEVEVRGFVIRHQEVVFEDLGVPPRVTVSLERECRVLGRVVCEDGRALPDVWIGVVPRPILSWREDEVGFQRTNADGRFEVGSLPSGTALRLSARTSPSVRDPCSEASAPFPVEQCRETVTVVTFRRPGETIDVGDLVLSEIVWVFRGESEASPPPAVLPAPKIAPR